MTPFLRPEVRALFLRWSETALGALIALFGLWIFLNPGLIAQLLGGAVMALGAGQALLGFRRMRFQGDPAAPGLVEIDEGRLRYLHPRLPGEISLNDLAELDLVTLRGRRLWRLRDLQGQSLLVPLDASGAGALFDAFSALPGLGSAGLIQALDQKAPGSGQGGAGLPAATHSETRVWARPGSGLRRM